MNKPKYFDETYNNESNLIESLYAFHPDHFSDLTSNEFAMLQKYYMFTTTNTNMPENIFAYRAELLQDEPLIEERAKDAARKIAVTDGFEDDEIEKMFS